MITAISGPILHTVFPCDTRRLVSRPTVLKRPLERALTLTAQSACNTLLILLGRFCGLRPANGGLCPLDTCCPSSVSRPFVYCLIYFGRLIRVLYHTVHHESAVKTLSRMERVECLSAAIVIVIATRCQWADRMSVVELRNPTTAFLCAISVLVFLDLEFNFKACRK